MSDSEEKPKKIMKYERPVLVSLTSPVAAGECTSGSTPGGTYPYCWPGGSAALGCYNGANAYSYGCYNTGNSPHPSGCQSGNRNANGCLNGNQHRGPGACYNGSQH
jgi:hypothetical protein